MQAPQRCKMFFVCLVLHRCTANGLSILRKRALACQNESEKLRGGLKTFDSCVALEGLVLKALKFCTHPPFPSQVMKSARKTPSCFSILGHIAVLTLALAPPPYRGRNPPLLTLISLIVYAAAHPSISIPDPGSVITLPSGFESKLILSSISGPRSRRPKRYAELGEEQEFAKSTSGIR